MSSFLLPYFLLSIPTFSWMWYKCLPFLPLSHSFCHFFISFAINPFTSVLLIYTLMSICACFKACLARWSASSFPSTPMCDGTHMKFSSNSSSSSSFFSFFVGIPHLSVLYCHLLVSRSKLLIRVPSPSLLEWTALCASKWLDFIHECYIW